MLFAFCGSEPWNILGIEGLQALLKNESPEGALAVGFDQCQAPALESLADPQQKGRLPRPIARALRTASRSARRSDRGHHMAPQ